MNKRCRVVSLTAAILLTAIGSMAGNSEPNYQGHTLTEWVDQIDPEIPYVAGSEPPAYNAIRQIGTNAIPTVLKWLATGSVDRARKASFILSEQLSPAVPELTRLALRLKEYKRFDDCVEALGCIGPKAVPGFKILLTKGRPEVQFAAIEYLPMLHTNACELMPCVVKCIVGKDEEVGNKAADILGRLDVPDSAVTPMLTNALAKADAPGRLRIYRAVFWRSRFLYPPNQCANAISLLKSALADSNRDVRSFATNALQDLQPANR